MKRTTFFVAFSFFLCVSAFGGWYDSGYIEFRQPDETSFIGREYGDEFIFYRETESGYRYVKEPDGWYYYAIVNGDGDLVSSGNRVGIDAAPAQSYQASYTGAKLQEIEAWHAEFEEQVALAAEWFSERTEQARAQGMPATMRLGVILVEFQDVIHYRDTTNEPPVWPYGYLKAHFDSLLFSRDFWYAPNDTDFSPHPEGHRVFGSMRDYYWQMSQANGTAGALIVTGTVVNPPDVNGVPQWIRLPDSAHHYDFFSVWPAARDSAIAQFGLDTTHYDRFVLIFPKNPGIIIAAYPSKYYTMVEQPGRPTTWFSHIGTHAHEFGHLLGFFDEYLDDTNPREFDLMAYGNANGPNFGNCPAPLSPYYRTRIGWVTPLLLMRDTTQLTVGYDYAHPIYYRINPIDRTLTPDEHFLIEVRLRQGFDLYTPLAPSTFQEQSGTLLIWRHDSGTDGVALNPRGQRSEQSPDIVLPWRPTVESPELQRFQPRAKTKTSEWTVGALCIERHSPRSFHKPHDHRYNLGSIWK